MLKFLDAFISLIFPRRCPFCGHVAERSKYVCAECAGKLPFVTGKTCPNCGRGLKYCRCSGMHFRFDGCAVPFYYEGIVRRGIVNFKFYERQTSASAFSHYAAEAVRREYPNEHFDFVSCVPLTKKERKKRGFNQSEIFARSLARELSLPYRDTLVKPNDVLPQRKLKAGERRKNISGAFCAKMPLHGENILLADDIITTGATLDDCARALKSAGCGRVSCAVIACVRRRDGS